MFSKKVFASSIAATLLAVSATSQAADNQWYVGIGGGWTDTDTGISSLTGTASLDEEDTGYKIFAGYNFNENIALEGFYVDLGEATLTGNNGDTFVLGGTTYAFTVNNARVSSEGTAFGVGGKFTYPFNETFNVFGKLGLAFWDIDGTVSGSGLATSSVDDDGTDAYFGVGAGLKFADSWEVRAEAERYDFGGDDVDFVSLSIVKGF
ncbi:MAG: outer membrane beta-barrel protein [Chromatiales bacterium]|jgi:OOP family OmpA-OmpF porin